ncbi:DNA repair endonuclease XPF-like isoform X3 [Portunus trituberculatus]|uniref:DNA repair endonuclease XPF-like isoform X3 n=1 Tax=Portunus trituberculatus TaxID=210409 RepID=UPI001E1CC141|nr:DNA repair endonuclease XPF-like isoform X3 [Portunus trituberculatus]
MLEYENQMLLDLLHEDGLLVTAKGLGIERILVSLITTFNDAGNLVLVMGTTPREEEYLLAQLESHHLTPPPCCITADYPTSERTQVYYNGGVLFVTTRILVMDLLMERIPVEMISGIIVWKAHRILESCQEAFALRLYRQKNKTGFVKALSSSPLSFTAGFCHVERIMRNLFVKKLYLWPRFHVDVNTCLEKFHPEVVELHLSMTPAMKEIQMSLLDLITATVQELRRSNSTIDTEEFTPENAISKSFDKILKIQLDPIWHQLSPRTRTLVADLKVLKTVLGYLTQYDCVTFYNLVNSLRTTEEALKSSGWMLLSSADSLFLNSKHRVFGTVNNPKVKNTKEALGACSTSKDLNGLCLEVNPKWVALSEILDEIQKEVNESKHFEKCLVVTQDDRTSQQLREYLVHGSQVVLQRIFYKTVGQKLGFCPPDNIANDTVKKNIAGRKQKYQKRDMKKTDHPQRQQKVQSQDGGKKIKKQKLTESEMNKEEMTLTQLTKQYNFVSHSDSDDLASDKEDDEEGRLPERRFLSPLTLVQSVKTNNDPFKMTRLLEEVQPKYIIMYDSDLSFIRQLEVWQARHVERVRVYLLLYKGTTEEQIYLTNVKREKDAFEYLIKEKVSMVIPEYNDGKTGDHPDLIRDSRKATEILADEKTDTRKGGQTEAESKPQQRIIVDMREFRSELPSLIHKRGIDIDPVTIEGRYFLSSDGSSSSKDIAAKLQLLTIHFPHLKLLWCPSPYASAEIFQMLKADREEPAVSQAEAVTAETNPDVISERYNPQVKDFVSKLPGINTKNMYSLLNKIVSLSELLILSKEQLTEVLGSSTNAETLHNSIHQCIKPPDQLQDTKRGGKFTKKGRRRFQTRLT